MENDTITSKKIVCKFWLQGQCTRNPCALPHVSPQDRNLKRRMIWKNHNAPKKHLPEELKNSGDGVCKQLLGHTKAIKAGIVQAADVVSPPQDDHNSRKCKILNAPQKHPPAELEYSGDGLNLICKLQGHTKAITGIMLVLSYGHDTLYSASKDLTVRYWDSDTRECVGCHTSGLEVGCLLGDGPWLFAGALNSVKVQNLQSDTFYELDGPGGHYHCMAFSADTLFVGTEDGIILIWRWWPKICSFEWYAVLEGHSASVCSLITDSTRLYSGSKDCAIKVWDVETMKCVQTLYGHTKEVNSLLFWNKTILVSASMDKTLKFWGPSPTKSGNLEMIYEKKENHGVVTLSGMLDEKNQTILLCSCDDHIVRLYDLPTFNERGRIFSRDPVQVIKTGTHFLFFTGDAGGEVAVWELVGDSPANSS